MNRCTARYTLAKLGLREKMHLLSVGCCCVMEVDLQIVIVHATKAYSGSTRITPLILYPGTRCRWVINSSPRLHYAWERKSVTPEEEAVWAPSSVRTVLREEGRETKLKSANRFLWKSTNHWKKSLHGFRDVRCRQMDSQKYRSLYARFFVAKNLMDLRCTDASLLHRM